MTIIGIDPGLHGAIAVLTPAGALAELAELPALGGEINAPQLADLIAAIRDRHPNPTAWVEDVHAMPRQGVSSTFGFGVTKGVILGVLAAYRIPTRRVAPSQWKRTLGVAKDKTAARGVASNLWPDQAARFARVKDDGLAEAALIAEYGHRQRITT